MRAMQWVLALMMGLVCMTVTRAAGQESAKVAENQDDSRVLQHWLLESKPPGLQASIETRDRLLSGLPEGVSGPQSVINLLKRWQPGQTITVAFLGGSPQLHKMIVDATKDWTDNCNVKLDFGHNLTTNTYRTWSPSDTQYTAMIRVSFDKKGYWSLVGTDCIQPAIEDSVSEAGGSPHRRSMNFGGFHLHLPSDWRRVVLHEFGHALGFEHEHQQPGTGCEQEFRWNDDPGYVATVDQSGRFVQDAIGRRPGIYTVLGGPPNKWPKHEVDFNLRQLTTSHAYFVAPFDKNSIMKYHFEEWMFVSGSESTCFSAGENLILSDRDKSAAKQLYPFSEETANDVNTLQDMAAREVEESPTISEKMKNFYRTNKARLLEKAAEIIETERTELELKVNGGS